MILILLEMMGSGIQLLHFISKAEKEFVIEAILIFL